MDVIKQLQKILMVMVISILLLFLFLLIMKMKPEEGFVYLKNKGNFKFQPYSLPAAKDGRWLTMDAGDIDGDGKTDIILGNFSLGEEQIKPPVNWTEQPPFLVIEKYSITIAGI